MKHIKNFIRELPERYKAWKLYRIYSGQFKRYLQIHHIANVPEKGEDEYIRYWSQLTDRIEPYSYRLFSRFCGQVHWIIPEDIGHSIIERRLNPIAYRGFLSDKNLFATYLRPAECLPQTLLCRINGGPMLDKEFTPPHVRKEGSVNEDITFASEAKEMAAFLENEPRIVLKPTVNTCSGNGVMLFELTDEGVYKSGDTLLDGPFLQGYNSDFVIQKVLKQHPYLSQFNETSVNTLRIVTYKSVRTGEISITYAGIRIGRTGAFVDNAHAGGSLVSIDRHTGQLSDFSYDQYGQRSRYANGIDLTKHRYVIPNWPEVLSFAKNIALQIVPMHLLALDIMIDIDGSPRLIEFNCNGFGFWYPMFVGLDPFGGKADEVIEYCKQIK